MTFSQTQGPPAITLEESNIEAIINEKTDILFFVIAKFIAYILLKQSSKVHSLAYYSLLQC